MVREHSLSHHIGRSIRRAFTMIELIFAIVIIAVVMLTIPMMIQVNNKAVEGNAAQEAIFLVSAVLSGTTTQLWDDSALGDSFANVSMSKILDTGGNSAYDRVAGTNIRKGGLDEDLHRSFFSATSNPGSADIGTTTDSTAAGSLAGYTNQYFITTTRSYISDAPASFSFTNTALVGATSNIKMSEVLVKATVNDVNVSIARLRAYVCNIGEVDFAKRRF